MKHQTLNFILTFCLLASLQPLTATEPKVTPKDTVVIETDQWWYSDYINSDGYCTYLSENIEGYATFKIRVYSNDNPFGMFSWENEQMDGSVCYYVPAGKADTTYFTDGELLVIDEGLDCTLTGWVMDENDTYFQLKWNKARQGTYRKDAKDKGFTAEFTESEVTITDQQYGKITVMGERKNDQQVYLTMYVDNCSSYLLPAGEYVISDITNPGTAFASPGVTSNTVRTSYAANRSEENKITDRWYLVKGKVTVSYDENQLMTMTIAAENTYGQPVNVTLTKSFEGVDFDGEVRDSHGIIIRPAKGTAYRYWRSSKTYSFINSYVELPQLGRTVFVECDDNTVYWYNPSYAMRYGYWIKGTKEGNSYVFPAGQPVKYVSSSKGNYNMCWVSYRADTAYAGRCAFLNDTVPFILDGVGTDTIRLRGVELTDGNQSSEPVVGFYYSQTGKLIPTSDFGMLFFRPAPEVGLDLLVPPADLKVERLPYTTKEYFDDGTIVPMQGSVLVGWDGDDVYIQGLGFLFPKSWIKGTLSGDQVTFPKFQYLGEFDKSTSIWLSSESSNDKLIDYVMQYDKDNNTFYSNEWLNLLGECEDDGVSLVADGYLDTFIGYPAGSKPTDFNTLPYKGKAEIGSFKVFENGQLRILRNDKRYTILGVGE